MFQLRPGILSRAALDAAAGPAGDPHWASVVFLAGFEGVDGTNATYNEEKNSRAGTPSNAGVQIDSDQKKFGATSIVLPGYSGYTFADHADWHFGTGYFTVECFIRISGGLGSTQYLVSQWGGNQSWVLFKTYTDFFAVSFSTSGGDELTDLTTTGWSPSTNVWYHVAVDYDGTKYRLYVDGVMRASSTTARNIFNSTAPLAIGVHSNGSSYGVTGWLDEVRITKGVARYASDGGFTALTAAFPRA